MKTRIYFLFNKSTILLVKYCPCLIYSLLNLFINNLLKLVITDWVSPNWNSCTWESYFWHYWFYSFNLCCVKWNARFIIWCNSRSRCWIFYCNKVVIVMACSDLEFLSIISAVSKFHTIIIFLFTEGSREKFISILSYLLLFSSSVFYFCQISAKRNNFNLLNKFPVLNLDRIKWTFR